MPFAKKRRFSRKGRSKRGGSRFGGGRRQPRIKDVSSWYPPTAKCTAQIATGWIANGGNAGATYQQCINVLLNGTYRPLFFTDPTITTDHQNTCPPNYYASAAAPGAGLVGSINSNAPYQQYRVEGAMVTLEMFNTNAFPIQYIHFLPAIVPSGGLPGLPPGPTTIYNEQKTHYECILPASGAINKPVRFKRYFSMRKDCAHMTKDQWDSQHGGDTLDWAVTVGGVGSANYQLENPPRMQYLIGSFYTMARANGGAGGPVASTIFTRISVKYYVTMFNRNDIFIETTTPTVEEKEPLEDYMEDEPVMIPPLQLGAAPAPRPQPEAALAKKPSLSSPLKRMKL